MVSSSLLSQFIRELRRRHYAVSNPYDQQNMWDSFQYYWKFLKAYAVPRLTECTPEQWHAYMIHVINPETADVRTRRGGKSLMLANLTFFFAIIKFGRYEGKVLYRAVFEKQIVQFREWCRKNPFFVKFSEKDKDYGKCMYIHDSEPASVDELSEASTASLGASVLLLDEGGKAQMGLVKEQYCRFARGMLIEGDMRARRIVHASTPSTNTYFEEIYNYLHEKEIKSGQQLTVTMPYQQCPWITEEVINEEREMNLNAPWIVPQEFECCWIAHGGNFFDQSHLHILGRNGIPIDLFEQRHILPMGAGLDWNGDLIGHILYEVYYDQNDLYIMSETKLNSVIDVKAWVNSHQGVHLEVEGQPKKDGFNAGYSDHLMSLGVDCAYQGWEVGNNLKDQRLAILQRCNIYVHPNCKWFIKNYQEAAYDPKSLVPKLLKTNDQHGLDAVLHALHYGGNLDIITNNNSYEQQQFDNVIDSVGMRSHIF